MTYDTPKTTARIDCDGRAGSTASGVALSRRSLLKVLGLGWLVPASALGQSQLARAQEASEDDGDWTVVAIPDTQKYAEIRDDGQDFLEYAEAQTQWIADNLTAENIAFVSHEGDLVEHAAETAEWDRIETVLDTIDGIVPYSTVPGNHDWGPGVGNKLDSIGNYRNYFGDLSGRFNGADWFGGFGPDSDNKSEGLNSYQTFSAGGYDFLHLALEWEPSGDTDDPDTSLGWAQDVLDDHPQMPTMVTTHAYLRDDTQARSTETEAFGYDSLDIDGNSGEEVFQKLVDPNPQIFMVLNGHFHNTDGPDEGEFHQLSNADGDVVFEILANYQARENGGDSLMRLIHFEPGGGSDGSDRIHVQTLHAMSGEFFEEGDQSEFAFELDFDERFSVESGDENLDEPGNVDGDGDVDEDDVKLVQRHIAGEDLDGEEFNASRADLDEDDDIDIVDAMGIRNKAEEGG